MDTIKQSIIGALNSAQCSKSLTFLPDELRYTSKGSELYEYIKMTPNYYLMRSEVDILTTCKNSIMDPNDFNNHTVIDLGAGYGDKARLLLPGLLAKNVKVRYLPIDVSLSALVENIKCMQTAFPQVEKEYLHATYEDGIVQALSKIKDESDDPDKSLITLLFAGSTIGNMKPGEDVAFIRSITQLIIDRAPEYKWRFLLGTDLAPDSKYKTVDQAVKAYENDSSGYRDAFMSEIIPNLNNMINADMSNEDWDRHVEWNSEESAVHQILVCNKSVKVNIDGSVPLEFPVGSKIGISRHIKYSEDDLAALAIGAGLYLSKVWKSCNKYFAFAEMKPGCQPDSFNATNTISLTDQWLNVVDISELCHPARLPSEWNIRSVAQQLSVALEKIGLVTITGYQNLFPEEYLVKGRADMIEFCKQPQQYKDSFNKGKGFGKSYEFISIFF